MDIKFNVCCLNIDPKLYVQLQKAIQAKEVDAQISQVTVNYRDSSYSSKTGGYQPVEISLQKEAVNGCWCLLYITDFCYCGHPYPELVKEVDFDFSANTFFLANCTSTSITRSTVKDFYKSWENNFLSYLEYDAFDQIEVSAW
ncbi:DUF2787 domain-containing protein [Psychromonas antarctica]|uniref:DUF2787 domain-containing protein n=1 Tax=Psychromonas antarctica TaxID=67573 RepID=UPI001EE9915B|nr:DUF2787 domain-containing protein [Psychromonas antarctica]MCG6202331.1 DUF2787 domain-containing protein [Psychromonas antarctica]